MMHPKVTEYVKMIQEETDKHYAQKFPTLTVPTYEIVSGRKYHKIVQCHVNSNNTCHSFVDNHGNLYKAASWSAPTKDVRYNLNTDMDIVRERFDPYGGYLYK